MIPELARRMIEGLFAPARSARHVLAAKYDVQTAIQFAVLAYVLQAVLQILIPGARPLPEGVDGVSIFAHVFNIVIQLALLWVTSMAIYGGGQLFGGTGTREQAFVLVCWHALVTTLIAPLFLLGVAQIEGEEIPPAGLFVLLIGATQYLWLLASYTTVLHGFSSVWRVIGVMMGLVFLLSAVMMNFVSIS